MTLVFLMPGLIKNLESSDLLRSTRPYALRAICPTYLDWAMGNVIQESSENNLRGRLSGFEEPQNHLSGSGKMGVTGRV